MSTAHWRKDYDELDVAEEWHLAPVDVPLDAAVTVVLSASGSVDPGPEEHNPENHYQTWHHAPLVPWLLQDSLDGKVWHTYAYGTIGPESSQHIRRLSSPMGTHARLAFRVQAGFVKIHTGGGTVQSQAVCDGRQPDVSAPIQPCALAI